MSRYWIRSLTLFAAYVLTGYAGLLMPAIGTSITLIWLPTGIVVGFLYRGGYQYWPAVAISSVCVNLATGVAWPASLCIAIGNTLGPLLTTWLLRRYEFHPQLERNRDIILLSVTAHLGMLISATNGVAMLALFDTLEDQILRAWFCWWAGDSMGVIAATPLLLVAGRTQFEMIERRLGEFIGWLVLTMLVTFGVFVLNGSQTGPAWALAFVPFPLIAWATMRFGATGTSLAVILIAIGASYGASVKSGPFYRSDAMQQVVLLWSYMATMATLGWLITSLRFSQLKAISIQRSLEHGLRDANLGFLLADTNRLITYVNDGFTRLTGYTAADLLGMSCSILQGPDTDAAIVNQIRTVLNSGGHFDGEILNYRKDGTTFWNALVISPIYSDDGRLAGFLGTQRDITAKKKSEIALQRSESRLRTILDLEPECVKIVSRDGCLVEMNRAGLEMIEADSIEQVRGAFLVDLIVDEYRDAFAAMHADVLAGDRGHCEFRITGLHGTQRWLESNAVPYRDSDGAIIGQLAVTRDITERKQSEDALRLSEERHRGFVENSSTGIYLYEFVTPISIDLPEAEQVRRLATEGYIALANDTQAKMYGYERGEQIVGLRAVDLYQTLENEANNAFLLSFVQSGYRIKNAKSEEFDKSGNRIAFSNDCLGIVENGYLIRIWGTQRDVTDQHNFEAAVRTLLEITASTSLPFKEQLQRMLELGCTQFRLTDGSVITRDPDGNSVAQSWRVDPGSERHTQDGSVNPDTPATSVLETEITIADEQLGLLRFSSAAARASGFSQLEQDFLTLMARWVGSQLQLQSTLSRQRAIVENSPDYVILLDRANKIRFINRIPKAAEHLEIIGASLMDLSLPEFQPAIVKCLNEVWATGVQEIFEGPYLFGDLELKYFESRVTPVNDGGHIGGLVVTATDITDRKQTMVSLEESRDRIDQILSSIEVVVYSASSAGDEILFISDYAETLYGSPASEFRNDPKKWFSVIHPADRERVEQAFAAIEMTGTFHLEYRIIRPDGSVRWLLDRSRMILNSDGVRLRLDGVASDVTDRKTAEEELKASEARYRQLFRSNPHPMWVYDLETLRFLAVNSAAVYHYGFSQEEFLAMTIKDIRPPGDIPALLVSVAQSGTAFDKSGIWRHRVKDGRLIDVEIASHPLIFDERAAELVLANDVTERRRLEEQVRATQERFQAIVERSHDLILIFDREGYILFVNPASREILGREPQEMIGRHNLEFLTSDDHVAKSREAAEIMQSPGKEFRTEIRAVHRDGTTRILDAIGVNLIDIPSLSGIVVNCRDITERKEADDRTANELLILELLATGASLETVLERIVRNSEQVCPGMTCSVMLADEKETHLVHCVAPGLPEAFRQSIEDLRIGPNAGSCGKAAYTRQRVITSELATDPCWVDYRDLALSHGLQACWSTPMFSSSGKLMGAFAMYFSQPKAPSTEEIRIIDRGVYLAVLAIERSQLLTSLRDSRIRLETLVGNLPGMAYRCQNDAARTMTYVSSGCELITGFHPSELEQHSSLAYGDLIHPDDRERFRADREEALRTHVPYSGIYRVFDKSRQTRWVLERATGVYSEDASLLWIDGFIQDITESRRIEQQVRASLREKEAMLREIHHRVKNNLQIISSLLNLQLDKVDDSAVQIALRESQNRVRSMALVHETLYLSGSLGRIDLAEYVRALCRHLFRSYGIDTTVITLTLDVSKCSLDLDRAIPFGLIINELVSNSLKYAFPERRSGNVQVQFLAESEKEYVLVVSDDGVGLPELLDLTQLKSLGLTLVQDLIKQLSGSVTIVCRPGTAVSIRFPIQNTYQEGMQ